MIKNSTVPIIKTSNTYLHFRFDGHCPKDLWKCPNFGLKLNMRITNGRRFYRKAVLGKQRGYKRLNCAQAVAEAFRQEYDFLTEETVKDFKKMGYGKAPNGECGMLFAAKYIFEKNGRPDKAQEFENYFREFAGIPNAKS